jgi:peptidoglycan hydrolase-like protein with peptidoglycan-binding domain
MGDRRARARGAAPTAARRSESKPRSGSGGGGGTRTATLDPRQASVDPTPAELYDLQRSAGNAAVLELVQRALDVQRKDPKKDKKDKAPWMKSTRPVLRLGDGPLPSVAQLQQALNGAVPGKPLRITGMFDADTQAKVKEYQRGKDFPFVTGVANKQTWWNLDKDAPHVVRQGSRVVLGPEKGEARMESETGSIHPTIKLGSKGPAVEELQKKLNTLPAKDISIYLSTHGKFDKTTRLGVIDFQKSRKPPLKANGVVGKDTWAAIDGLAGPVDVGREDFRGRQRAEGVDTGADTHFTWRILPDRLQVNLNFKFTGATKDPMVETWLGQIRSLWNTFKFVDTSKPGKSLLLDFNVGKASPGDATVRIHATPKKAKKIPRSDAANWHTGDKDPGLAPHEFGHVIGLQDEYNKGPEQYTITTGEQPGFGEVEAPTDDAGDPVPPEKIAQEIWKAVNGSSSTRGKRARKIVDKYNLVQGGFAQRVAAAYEKEHASKLKKEIYKDGVGYKVVKAPGGNMGDDLAARIPGSFDDAPDEWAVVAPFFYSNRGIMGTMEELSSPSGIDPHDHPVAERHVRHFLQIVQKNRPGSWRTVRR